MWQKGRGLTLTQATWGGDQDTVNETLSIKGMEDNFPSLHHKSTVEVSNVCPWHSCSRDTGALYRRGVDNNF